MLRPHHTGTVDRRTYPGHNTETLGYALTLDVRIRLSVHIHADKSEFGSDYSCTIAAVTKAELTYFWLSLFFGNEVSNSP